MSDFVIEHGVPIPAKRKTGRSDSYPFRELGVGDSFFVAANGDAAGIRRNRLTAAARNYLPKKFITRIVDGGVRVWRIA